MPKRPKSGPPYTDIPTEIYVVVTNPFGMHLHPRMRGQSDFNRVASWAQFVLKQTGLGEGRIPTVECIYSMGTRDEIILQFEEGTDIIPLLGEHRWTSIARDGKFPPNDPRATRVFIYNWRNNGDPANHNWTENYPSSLPMDSIPIKSPYPAPSWTQPPSTLTNFVHPIPRPPVPPPIPNHEQNPNREQQPKTTLPPPSTEIPPPAPPRPQDQPESAERSVAQDSASANLYKPYEPPSQHPSHGQFLNRQQVRVDEATPPRALPPPPKFIKKLDPYEQDEEALNALRSPEPNQEDIKDIKNEDVNLILPLSVKLELPEVKIEEDDAHYITTLGPSSRYQPSQALTDAYNSLVKSEQVQQVPSSARSRTRNPRMRRKAASQAAPPPPPNSGYQPSAELAAEVNLFLRGTTASSLASGARPRATVVKREYEEDVVTSLGERKRIKVEEC